MEPVRIAVNGTELAFVEQGQGQPLVLVHGALQDYRFWEPHLEPFARYYQVIAYSRRGNYPHAAAPGAVDATGDVHGEDLAALIGELGLGRPYIVGHSAGAMAALWMASRYPELPRALVLCEPPAAGFLLASPSGQAVLRQFGELVADARRAFRTGAAETGVRLWAEALNGPGAYEGLPPEGRAMMLDNANEMMGPGSAPPGAAFTAADARQIAAPALMLRGQHSPLFFHRILDELAQHLSGAKSSATIPGAGHTLQRANPAAFRAATLAFLAEH